MPFPIKLNFIVEKCFGGIEQTIHLYSGLTTFVGPNASGKTRALRALRQSLNGIGPAGSLVRFISAGRLSPLEVFRSDMHGSSSGNPDASTAYAGHRQLLNHRKTAETVSGDILTLKSRADLLLKVQSRLNRFFGRQILLAWGQNGVEIQFRHNETGEIYSAGTEASGLLHLAGLLAAIHNDETHALLLDEPEVSLHPQLQSYLLQEIQSVCGDPSVRGKKIVIIATHSASMLNVVRPNDLANIVFFIDQKTQPRQISPDAQVLGFRSIRALLARLSDRHKLAFFCRRIFMVEGPSDEIICNSLASRLKLSLGAGATQIVPLIGKGEFPTAIEAFANLGREAVILADLDNVADDGKLIGCFYGNLTLDGLARETHRDFKTFAQSTISDFKQRVSNQWTQIAPLAELHSYWKNRDTNKDEMIAKHRSALASLLSCLDSEIEDLSDAAMWLGLQRRLRTLFDWLEQIGCFILRKGAIEDYYRPIEGERSRPAEKPYAAAEEAEHFDSDSEQSIREKYDVIVRALTFASSTAIVDEAISLRRIVAAVASSALTNLPPNARDSDLQIALSNVSPDYLQLLKIESLRSSKENTSPGVRISLESNIFNIEGFPIEIRVGENPIEIVEKQIKKAAPKAD